MIDLSKLRAAFPSLSPRLADGGFDVGPIEVREEESEWLVSTPEAHCHLETFDEAIDMVIALLRGHVRTTSERRNDTLAASWFEVWDEDAYKVEHKAVFLSPFDADEWVLWEGEEWRQKRTTYVYDPLEGAVQEESFERVAEPGEVERPDMAQWLEKGLGPAAGGFKWTVSADWNFVFQAPKGWRIVRGGKEEGYLDLSGPEESLFLRTRTYYREVEQPVDEPILEAVHASSIDYSLDDENEDWFAHTWKLIFTDGREDMMGILELYFPSDEPASAIEIRRGLDATVQKAIMAPPDWDMSPPRS
jgi:hypothetical protein